MAQVTNCFLLSAFCFCFNTILGIRKRIEYKFLAKMPKDRP